MKLSAISLLISFTLLCSSESFSQKSNDAGGQPGYTTSLGLRFGFEGGVSFKHFIGKGKALEGILSTGWGYGGYRLTGLFEVHKPFPGVQGLDWFFGGGAHIGMYSGRYYGYAYGAGQVYYDRNGKPVAYRASYMSLGIDGIIGLEYQFEDLPLTATLDFKPFVDLIGGGNRFGDGALTVRYIFK